MTEAIFKSRRDFLAGSTAAVTAASMPLPASAASGFRHFAGRPLLVLYQAHDPHASAFAAEFSAAGYATLALTDDPVRQWRDGLSRLVRDEHLLLIGLSNWSDYSMLSGLAAEERRFPLFHRRQAKRRGNAWAREYARTMLAVAGADDAEEALRDMGRMPEPPAAAPSLFSWAL